MLDQKYIGPNLSPPPPVVLWTKEKNMLPQEGGEMK